MCRFHWSFGRNVPCDPGSVRIIKFPNRRDKLITPSHTRGMDKRVCNGLHRAPYGDKAVRVRDCMWHARPVPGMGTARREADRTLRKRPGRVRKWPRRHGEAA